MIIVQVGCNHGDDHVFEYIDKNKDNITSAYLIESLHYPYSLAVDKYKDYSNVKLFNIAITDEEDKDEIELFTTSDSGFIRFEGASFNKDHVTIHTQREDIESIKIKCCSLNKFLSEQNIKTVDRLYVDTEGLDCRILAALDFEQYDIKRIQFEFIHSANVLDWGNSEILNNVKTKLQNYGYNISVDQFDIIAEKIGD
jgi:FkbM family methyltransferase